MSLLDQLRLVIPLGVALVLIAALFRMRATTPRRRLRRSAILYALYLALVLCAAGARQVAVLPGLTTGLRIAAELCELLLIINLAALALFDLLLPSIRMDLPDILHDVAVGAAYLVAIAWLLHR